MCIRDRPVFVLVAVALLDVDHARVVEYGGPYGVRHRRAPGHGLEVCQPPPAPLVVGVPGGQHVEATMAQPQP
eukprot:2522833-Alexandrium_andersonii.AAC.1